MNGRFKNMVTIEESELTTCVRCKCYIDDSDSQTICHHCTGYTDDEIPIFLQVEIVIEALKLLTKISSSYSSH